MTSASRASFTLANNTAELDALRTFVKKELEASPLSESEQNMVVLAVDEAVSNIIQHAYDADAEETIAVELETDERRLAIFIRDSGRSFDPSGRGAVEINEHVGEGKRRGLGIFLMRRIMDEVHYDFQEGVRNELVLIKNFAERVEG